MPDDTTRKGFSSQQASPHILILGTDETLSYAMRHALEYEGLYSTSVIRPGRETLGPILRSNVALLLLDIDRVGANGQKLYRRLRDVRSPLSAPIIVITSSVIQIHELLVSIDANKDDYLVKPFGSRDLLARVRYIVRSASARSAAARRYDDGTLYVDYDGFVVRVRGEDVALTRREFGLLDALTQAAGHVLSREQLLERLHGTETAVGVRSLDIVVCRLRKKLGLDTVIESIPGVGYRLRQAADAVRGSAER